jgi:transcription elongation factor S-II
MEILRREAMREVAHIQKKLEKSIECGSAERQVLNILKDLRDLPMNRNILTRTNITVTVNAIGAKSSDDKVICLVNELTTSWKKFNAGSSSGKENTPPSEKSSIEEKDQGTSSHIKAAAPIFSSRTADSMRKKSREMLCDAITGDGVPVGVDPQYLAQVLEECIHKECRNTDKKYTNKVRSKVYNLRDARNPKLRLKFLSGNISPQAMAKMTSIEMASEELQAMREKWSKETTNEVQSCTMEGAKIDTIRCDKCDKRNCTYTYVPKISTDELITSMFVQCNECGNRWYPGEN